MNHGGRGIEKITTLCESSGLQKPVFDASLGGLQIEFHAQSLKMGEKTSEKIISTLLLKPESTIAEMAEQIGVSSRSIERNLQNLQKDKKLERIGSAKGGYWKVNQ